MASVKINRLNFVNRLYACGDPQRVNIKEIIFFTLSNNRDSGMVDHTCLIWQKPWGRLQGICKVDLQRSSMFV